MGSSEQSKDPSSSAGLTTSRLYQGIRIAHRHNLQFACMHGLQTAYFTSAQRAHGYRRVWNVTSAVKTDFVGLLVQRKHSGQTVVATASEDPIEEVENRTKDNHETDLPFFLRIEGALIQRKASTINLDVEV